MAVSGGVVERFGSESPKLTCTVTAAVTAGRLVEMTSADRSVAHAGAASLKVVGVACQDASAVGDKIAVATGGVWNLVASGAITRGDQVISAATGKVATLAAAAAATAADINNARALVGLAFESIADTASGPIILTKTAC